jgi:hypothetical protein
MNSVKYVILSGVFTALLIGAQMALSSVSGVEIVTILFLCYCYVFGVKQGLLVANAFSLIRCFIFGFAPTAIILYLVYYNLFVLVFGTLGRVFKHEYNLKKHAVVVVVAVVMTALFTMLDNVITPLFYGFTIDATKAYFLASLYTLFPHALCSLCTSIILFAPLIKVLRVLKRKSSA